MEIKRTEIALQIQLQDFNRQKVIKISIDSEVAKELSLSLLLLKESLISTLELRFLNFHIFLNFRSEEPPSFTVIDFKKNILKAKISKNATEYVLFFLLKYYRDGIGESDHIDVDFENESGEEVTLTFLCNNYLEYSPKDLNAMLGL